MEIHFVSLKPLASRQSKTVKIKKKQFLIFNFSKLDLVRELVQPCLNVSSEHKHFFVCNLMSFFLFFFSFFQDTLIVWSEADNYDLALSFQEKAGCDEIWEKICQVRPLAFCQSFVRRYKTIHFA